MARPSPRASLARWIFSAQADCNSMGGKGVRPSRVVTLSCRFLPRGGARVRCSYLAVLEKECTAFIKGEKGNHYSSSVGQ